MERKACKTLWILILILGLFSCNSNRNQLNYSHTAPIYTNHSFFGPIKSSIILNLPLKNDSSRLYTKANGRSIEPNTYFKEYYLPLDRIHERRRSQYTRYDTLGNPIYDMGMGSKEDILGNANYIDSIIEKHYNKKRGGGHKYRFDLKRLERVKKAYGKGQRMPAFFKTHNLNPPNQIQVSFTREFNVFYVEGDTNLTWTRKSYSKSKKDTIIRTKGFNRSYLMEHKDSLDSVSNKIVYKYKSEGYVNNIGDNLLENFFDSLTLETKQTEKRLLYLDQIKVNVNSIDSMYELRCRAKVNYKYNDNGQIVKKTYNPLYNKYSLGLSYMLDGRGENTQSREDYHGSNPLEEVFTYDDLNRLKTHYYNLEHPFANQSTFYYSGQNTMPDSIWVFHARVTPPGEKTSPIYLLILDKEGKVTEVHYVYGELYYDNNKQLKFRRSGLLEKRILNYSDYDKYGNWRKVDIFVWLSEAQLKQLNKSEEYNTFWSKTNFVGSQERILEYYDKR